MACTGCVTLNDNPRTGVEPYDDLISSWEKWSQVLDPKWVVIFGGEPLMHPRFKELYQELRRIWPNARLMLPTNGLLLKNALDRDWIDSIKPIEFRISLHRPDMKEQWFKDTIKQFMALYPTWKPTRDEVLAAGDAMPHLYSQSHDDVYLSISYYDEFIVPYTFDQGRISPYNNDPAAGFSGCVSQENVYVYKGKLWKCFPYPNLRDTVPDFDQRWPEYNPYGPEDDLEPYFDNIARAENICRMCPSPEDHRNNVAHGQAENVRVLPSPKWIKNMVNKA
jgi:organic radical activating enzyme